MCVRGGGDQPITSIPGSTGEATILIYCYYSTLYSASFDSWSRHSVSFFDWRSRRWSRSSPGGRPGSSPARGPAGLSVLRMAKLARREKLESNWPSAPHVRSNLPMHVSGPAQRR